MNKPKLTDLIGQTFKTPIYESVVGGIVAESEILSNGTIYTEMFVVFPDGVHESIQTVQQGFEKLELEIN